MPRSTPSSRGVASCAICCVWGTIALAVDIGLAPYVCCRAGVGVAAPNRPVQFLEKQKAPTAVNDVAKRSCSWGFFPKKRDIITRFLITSKVTAFKRLAITIILLFKSLVKGFILLMSKLDTVNMYIAIKQYLGNLEFEQATKPKEERLEVPNLKELASEIEIEYKQFLRIANNQTTYPNMQVVARVIYVLRRRGFDTVEADVVRYVE